MDIDRLLNIERRTGIKNDDIDNFLDKATQVQQAIEGMLNGTVDPDSIKIDGIESEEEKLKKEMERQERLRIQEEKNDELKRKRKIEEKERWWSGAEIFKPMKEQSESSRVNSDEDIDPKKKLIDRYNFNYSRWDEWVPNDEASKIEEEERKKIDEEVKNKEFEENNPDFCKQFNEDALKRKESKLKKQESSDILRLKGNRFFKAKQYERAYELYMEALKESPYDSKTTLNIAQIFIKNKEYEDALEFIARTLYLDSKNVKALSRKAFVLSEIGKISDAKEVIKQALDIEPENIDLINLDKEIKIIEKEKKEEKMVINATKDQQNDSASSVKTKMQNKNSQEFIISKIDLLKEYIIEFQTLLVNNKNSENKQDCFNREKEIKNLILEISSAIKISDYSSNNNNNNHLVIYVRTSGLLKDIIDYIKSVNEIEKSKISISNVNVVDLMSNVLYFISICIDEQRSSKIIIIETKLVMIVKSLFPENRSSVSFSNLSEINLFQAYLKLLHNCCRDDICVKTRESILRDKVLVNYIGMLSGNISFNLKSSSSNVEITDKLVDSMKYCTLIIKEFAFSDFCQTEATSNSCSSLKGLVCSLSITFDTLLSLTETPYKSSVIEVINLSLEGLLGLSQYDFFRDFFAISIPSDNIDEKNLTTINIMMKSLKNKSLESELVFVSNCLACFMNASLESTGLVRNEIYRQGGLKLVEESLKSSDKDRKSSDSLSGNVFCRKAGLLSRLTSISDVNKFLVATNNFRIICRRISSFYKSSLDKNISFEKWEIDERSHYIRILASLVSTGPDCLESMRLIGLEESIIPSLLDIFPMPRQDCGVVTPQTVTLMPFQPISTLLLGNAARCLLIYADDLNGSKLIYNLKNKSDSLYGIEKFICAMATCTDMRVRKNIAILLAKGCKISGVREKITEFRGMQMMVELQDKL